MKKRVFSGIQPSGPALLGNYLGAIKHWAANQYEKTNYFCIVDLHGLTVAPDPEKLRTRTRELAAELLAAGIDPEQSILFIQSHVPAHAEASWLLSCVTPLGWLHRMTQYKDKSTRQESVLTGLLAYPVLMSGDILLYDADEVPVGDDQKQHVELARDIAQRFNHIYQDDFFVIPEAVIPIEGARIMGLDNPNVKMSKSMAHIRGHAVQLTGEPDEIVRAFKKATTDSGNDIRFSNDPDKAGVNNLLTIYQTITGKNQAETEADFADARGYGDLKMRVAEVTVETLAPIRERYNALMADIAELDRILAKGAEQAAAVSMPKAQAMKEAMGLILPKSS